ncbi:MAG: DUF177 domain-containing protein [Rikenellaceae bacterium]
MAIHDTTYAIAFQGLSIGNHQFEFSCDSDFLKEMSGGEIEEGDCNVVVNLEKGANLLNIKCEINGEMSVVCDRCLESFMQPVEFEGAIFVKFSSEIDEPQFDDDLDHETDVLWINPADSYIDLKQYIYESIVLSLPQRRIHPLDENGVSLCNPDMLERFSVEPDSIDDDADDENDDDDDGYNFK